MKINIKVLLTLTQEKGNKFASSWKIKKENYQKTPPLLSFIVIFLKWVKVTPTVNVLPVPFLSNTKALSLKWY